MGDRIVQAAKLTVEAVGLLGSLRDNAARLNAITEEIIRLEDDADTLNDNGIKSLFQQHRDGNAMELHRRRGDLRPSRKGDGPLRGRRQPHQRHRDRAGLNRHAALLIGLIAVALAFDFLNGRNDAANSIATIVSTRVLAPRYAVAWAAFFNFVAFLVFGLHVANTIGRGIVSPQRHHRPGDLRRAHGRDLLAGHHRLSRHPVLQLACADRRRWSARAWRMPGFSAIVWSGLGKTAAAIVLSPVTGLVIALLLVLHRVLVFLRAPPARVDGIFRKVQFVSASLYSLGHGGNDAQKTMGIIAALLAAHGQLSGAFHVPLWVVIACNGAMALGTLLGGWRIVRTMGSRITRLTPVQGVCAETAGSITLFMATGLGIPVSTTHTITGAIVGVGAARRTSAVRWNVAQEIVIAWVITMPAAGLVGALFYGLATLV